MPKFVSSFACAVIAALFVITASSAYAQNNHSWVSSTGNGDTCSRTVPCGTFSIALSATNAGGVISVLDQGAGDTLGSGSINKSITIRAEGVDAGTSFNPSPGSSFVVRAGANDVITLEGLHFHGGGVQFNSGGQLHVVRCTITTENVAGESGIKFLPSGASQLTVTDTIIVNQRSGTGAGIRINTASGGSAEVALKRVTVNGNAFGIAADGTGSTAGINMTIADSMVAGNAQDGIIATTPSGGAPIAVLVTNTQSINNAFGLRSIGPGVTIRVGDSTITGNGAGLTFTGGGALLTFGTNKVIANGSNGAFSGSLAPQ